MVAIYIIIGKMPEKNKIKESILNSQNYLLKLQEIEGYWCG